jgi:hypothetical protein
LFHPRITRYRNRLLEAAEPACFATLADWIYNEDISIPPAFTHIETVSEHHLKVAYFRMKVADGNRGVFVIRGTDNFENIKDDARFLLNNWEIRPEIIAFLFDIFRDLQARHGEISVVTGHSLGGMLLELLCHEMPGKLLGIQFNGYMNKLKQQNIISFRLTSDPAGAGFGHTTHLINSHCAILDAHKIRSMVYSLNTESRDWTQNDTVRANALWPNFSHNETAGCTDPLSHSPQHPALDVVEEIASDVLGRSCVIQ